MTDHNSVWDRPAFLQRRRIDLLCREFEDAWQAGNPVPIEEFLSGADSALRDELCGELIACEYELRTRSGEQPSASEYLRRFPELQSVIAGLNLDELRNESEFEQSGNSETVPASRGQLEPGDEFAGYRILRRLGAGGMGKVYLAEIPVISHAVALKILEVHPRHRERLAVRFEREARVLSRLDHPGIVPLYAYGETEGHRYLVMKAVAGVSLADALSGEGPASPSCMTAQTTADSALNRLLQVIRNPGDAERAHLLVGLCEQLAEALAAVHEAGILHRDIKPSNILLTTDGKIVLTDFGLAKDEAGTDDLTLRGEFIGTPRYAAPEAIDGRFSKQSDLYSLGLVLFELFSLKTPCGGTSLRNLLNSKLSGEVPELVASGWAAPHVEQAIRRLLHPASENRTPSVSEFLRQVRVPGLTAPQTAGSGFRQRAVGLVAVTMLILLTGVFMNYRAGRKNPDNRISPVARQLQTLQNPRTDSPPMERDAALQMRAEFSLPEGVLPRHVAISSDASMIVIASRSNEVYFADPALKSLELKGTMSGLPIESVAVSSNGKDFCIARPTELLARPNGSETSTGACQLDALSLRHPEWQVVPGSPFSGDRVAFRFVSGFPEQFPEFLIIESGIAPVMWYPDSGGIPQLSFPEGPFAAVDAFCFSTASVDQTGTVHVICRPPHHAASEAFSFSCATGISSVEQLRFAPDGRSLVTLGTSGLSIIALAQQTSACVTCDIPPNADLSFSDDGRFLAIWNAKKALLIDLENPRHVGTCPTAEEYCSVSAVSGGHLLLVEKSGRVSVMDFTASPMASALDVRGPRILTAAYADFSRQLVVGNIEGRIQCLKLRAQRDEVPAAGN